MVQALEAAKAYYQAEGSADSGYAVDDINGLIAKKSYNPVFRLSPEEEAEGFEILFDGTSLNRWKGNKTNYIPVDGDIRKACKGHNVDPGGSYNNPYTVDHLNHPGLFNKKGLISFCGHGPSVRFRNVRIKDRSK